MAVTEYRLYLIDGPGYSNDVHFLPRSDAIALKLQGYTVWDAHASLDMDSEWIEDGLWMTPQETSDYKMQWMREGGHDVPLHSDLDVAGKDWCRRNLERYQWAFSSYTANYQHTFHFENELHAQQFSVEFNDWVRK